MISATPRSLLDALDGDGLDVLKSFARAGLSMAPGKRNRELLLAYIQGCPIVQRENHSSSCQRLGVGRAT
jgi:hypothetical protein